MPKLSLPSHESSLEVGLVFLGGMLLVAAGFMVVSKVIGGRRESRAKAQPPPEEGEIKPERHQNVGAVSTR